MSSSGTDYFYLELNRDPNVTQGGMSVPDRSVGDVRFTLHEQGGDTIELLEISLWDGDNWVPQGINGGAFVGEVNDEGPVDLPTGWNSPAEKKATDNFIPEEQFLETYFNLTELIDLEPDCPPAFGTLNFRTTTGETGNDTGNNLKDFISPIPLDAPSTCGSLSIFKEDADGEPLGGAIFEIDPNPLPDGVAGSNLATLKIYDDSDDNTDVEVTPEVAVNTNYDDPTDAAGEITLTEIEPGTYTVRELAAPEGYLMVDDEKTLVVPSEGTAEERFGSVTFVNTKGSVLFHKTYGGSNADLPEGATFRVTRETDGVPGFTLADEHFTVQDNGTAGDVNGDGRTFDVTDEDSDYGDIKVSDLPPGDDPIVRWPPPKAGRATTCSSCSRSRTTRTAPTWCPTPVDSR